MKSSMKSFIVWLTLLVVVALLAACTSADLEETTGMDATEIAGTAMAVGGTAVSGGGTAVAEGGGTAVAAGETAVAAGGTAIAAELTPDPADDGEVIGPPGVPQPLAGLVSEMAQDLADRLDIAPEDVRFVESEDVEWPDASLGCPEPGMAYAQVITPGLRVTLEANGEQYDYHTDGERFVLCIDGQPAPDEL